MTTNHRPLAGLRLRGGAALAVLLLAAGCGQSANPGSPAADAEALGEIAESATTETAPVEQPIAPAAEVDDEPADEPDGEDSPGTDDMYCPEAAGWDTAAQSTDMTIAGAVIGLSGGSTSCVDSVNFMLDPSDQAPSYAVQYVAGASWQGSGEPLAVTGGAVLEVTIGSPLVDESDGNPEFIKESAAQMAEFNSFFAIEEIAFAGSFEGVTTFAMGISAELPFQVEVSETGDGTPYLTVSVAHQPTGGFGPEDAADNADEYAGFGGCEDVATWDIAPQTTELAMGEPIIGLAAGNTGCYEEFSIIMAAGPSAPGFDIGYTDVVRQDGSGTPVPVDGSAVLAVVIGSPAYDPETMEPTVDLSSPDDLLGIRGNFAQMQQVAFAGSFEGMTTFAIGLADEVPFAVDVAPHDDGEYWITVKIAAQ